MRVTDICYLPWQQAPPTGTSVMNEQSLQLHCTLCQEKIRYVLLYIHYIHHQDMYIPLESGHRTNQDTVLVRTPGQHSVLHVHVYTCMCDMRCIWAYRNQRQCITQFWTLSANYTLLIALFGAYSILRIPI